ncbi:MAG: HEPN domain-containing protein [Methanomassiliicoccaceae archaeon]|nr:HEPN domain-containing protein [Methanomassiliicoccaceae archaeon]
MGDMIVDEWLRYADNDLRVAHILSDHPPLQVEIICYHCQQASEKALKAFLLFSGCEPPKTHSLESLVRLCGEVADGFDDIVADCEYLNPYSVTPRYPFGLEIVGEDAAAAVQRCERIIGFIRNRIV